MNYKTNYIYRAAMTDREAREQERERLRRTLNNACTREDKLAAEAALEQLKWLKETYGDD